MEFRRFIRVGYHRRALAAGSAPSPHVTSQCPVQGMTNWYDLNGYPFSSSGGLSSPDAVVRVKKPGSFNAPFYVDSAGVLRRTADSVTLESLLAGADGLLEEFYDHKKANDLIIGAGDGTKPCVVPNQSWGGGTRNHLCFNGVDQRIRAADTPSVINVRDHDIFMAARIIAFGGTAIEHFFRDNGIPFLGFGIDNGQWKSFAGTNQVKGGTADTNEHIFNQHQSNTSADDGLYVGRSREVAVTTGTNSTVDYTVGDSEPDSNRELNFALTAYGFSPALSLANADSVSEWFDGRDLS